MDNLTVDLGPGEAPPAQPGAPVVLIGPGLPAEAMAARLGTLNYEVTCGISARVPREHHRGGGAP
jgi:alanine racemase